MATHSRNHFARYGEWAIVTGASSGIGRAFAMQLASTGLNVILVARDESKLVELANEIKQTCRVEVRHFALDLADADSVALLDAYTIDLDVGLLVASAGFGTAGEFLDSDLDQQLAMVDLNCRSVMEQAYRFGQRFKGRSRSGIILLSSIVAFQGMPYSANYAATKAYVQSLAEGLAHELAPHSIDVLSVAPGPTESAFAERAGMKLGNTASASSVASASLRVLGRRTSILPGFLAKLLGGPIAWLPRSTRVWLMGRIGKGMVDHG